MLLQAWLSRTHSVQAHVRRALPLTSSADGPRRSRRVSARTRTLKRRPVSGAQPKAEGRRTPSRSRVTFHNASKSARSRPGSFCCFQLRLYVTVDDARRRSAVPYFSNKGRSVLSGLLAMLDLTTDRYFSSFRRTIVTRHLWRSRNPAHLPTNSPTDPFVA